MYTKGEFTDFKLPEEKLNAIYHCKKLMGGNLTAKEIPYVHKRRIYRF